MEINENLTLENLSKMNLVKGPKVKLPDGIGGFKWVEYSKLSDKDKQSLNDWIEIQNTPEGEE